MKSRTFIKIFKKFLHYWNVFFTWLDNKQVLYWYKLTVYADRLEEQTSVPRKSNTLEEYEDWDKVQ